MSFAQGVTVVRALCIFYYGKNALGEKVRNRMRNVAVKRGAITEKGRKCINFVIENGGEAVKSQFYYEKSALGEKSRNRMRDEAVKKIVLLREK